MPLHGYTIAFDLDGTLVDTAPDLVRSLNVCMQGSGLGTTSIDQVRALIGQGARALIEHTYSLAGKAPDSSEVNARLAHFLDDYSANIACHSRVFEGAVECLNTLCKAGARLSICTNKSEALTLNLLQAFELTPYFDAIICPENVSAKKPAPEHVLAAIAPASPSKAIMIGDSITDLHSARAANVPVILMSHGYSDPPAEQLGADLVLDHFSHVSKAVFHLITLHTNTEVPS